MTDFLLSVIRITIFQLAGILGLFFLFGYVLATLQGATHQAYRSTFGWKGILWTAWIGTPVHELGHALFAKFFGHKIEKLSLYRPNRRTGGLGQVDHSYNNKNPYHQIGQFFIGAAPLICGSAAIALLAILLLPQYDHLFSPLIIHDVTEIPLIFTGLGQVFRSFFSLIFHELNWQIGLFLYISFAVTAHMAPSPEDRQSMYLGLLWMALSLFLINIICSLLDIDTTLYLLRSIHVLSILLSLLIFATVLSVIHYVVITIAFWPFTRRPS